MKLIQHTINFLVIATLIVHVSKNPILLAVKHFSPDTFTTLFCENIPSSNKKTKKSACNGHCKLMKMTAEQNHDSSSTPTIEIAKELMLFVPSNIIEVYSDYLIIENLSTTTFNWKNCYSFDFQIVNFKPPTLG